MDISAPSRTLELIRYEPSDMAWLLLDGEPIFIGNTWDFHAGCHGTLVAGYDVDGLWDRGESSLAGVLKLLMERDGIAVELIEREINESDADDRALAELDLGEDIEDEPMLALPPPAPPAPYRPTQRVLDAIGDDRDCDMCGEQIPAKDWCALCSDDDLGACQSGFCCPHSSDQRAMALKRWAAENDLL